MSQWKVVDFYIWLMLKESKKRKKEEKNSEFDEYKIH